MCFGQMLTNVQHDGIIVVRKIPINVLLLCARFNHRPDIRLPGQFVLGQGTEIAHDTYRMLIETLGERTGHGKEASTEAPMDTVHMKSAPKGPTTWNGEFGKACIIHFSEGLEKALPVFHDFENAVVQPKKSLVVRVLHGSLNELHLGIHEGVELLRVFMGRAMDG